MKKPKSNDSDRKDRDMDFTCECEGPWASPECMLENETGNWRYQRPVTNTAKCCRCGTCSLYCSSGCISYKGNHFTADMHYCKGCGVCALKCPVDAIRMVREK